MASRPEPSPEPEPETAGSVDFPEIQAAPFTGDPGDVDEPGHGLVLTEPQEPPALVEWTPERAEALVRGLGYTLHTFDPATSLPGGDDLWRATATEAREIGAPLARILARYEPARRFAGVVDEAELGAAFVSYAKRNMRQRGRVVLAAGDGPEGLEGLEGGTD